MYDIQPSRFPAVSLKDPAELVSALPALLGFYPQDALVAAYVRGGALRRLAHYDITTPDLAGACLELAEQCRPTGYVTLIVVSGGFYDEDRPITDPIPHASSIMAVRDALRAAGVTVRNVLWTPAIVGGEFWQNATNWRRHGVLPETIDNFMPAVAATLGRAVYPARPKSAEEPLPSAAERHRALRIRQMAESTEMHDHAQHLHLIAHALTSARDGHLPDADRDISQLTQAVTGSPIGDVVLAATIRHQLLEPARSLWLHLTRLTMPPEQTWPAALLGATAYIRGELPLARTALHIAAIADEDHRAAIPLLWFMARGGNMSQADWLAWLTEHRPAEDHRSGSHLDAALAL